MEKLKFWYKNARPVSLPQSMMPALVAVFMAAQYEDFRWYLALLSVIGIALAHLCFNLFDDYFDYRNAEQGDRTALTRMGFRAMTVKCPPLQDGTVTPSTWLKACLLFGAAACLCGVPVVLIRGVSVLWVVAGVAFLGLFYSAPPLKLGYHGLGELIIGSIFGPGIFIGMSYAAAGELHSSQVLVSIAMGLLVVAILYVHSIMDYAADTKAGKRTLAWLVGCHATIPYPEKKSTREPTEKELESGIQRQYLTLAAILFLPYLLVAYAVLAGTLSNWYFLVFLTLPWSADLFMSMGQFRRNPGYVPPKKKWYGPFQHWDQIKEAGIDWFMLRWLLAQRINMIFSLLCIIAACLQLID